MNPRIARPSSVEEAVAVLADAPDLTVVNGGTDVMVGVNDGSRRVHGWLSLRSVVGLDRIEVGDGGGVTIGAGATFAAIERRLPEVLPALAAAARTIGSPQIRRAGTIGGNLATASPAADGVPTLLCYDALVELTSATGQRSVALAELATGPKRTVLAPGELITAVHIPSCTGVASFSKVGTRSAMVISICSLAARLDADGGTARVAFGSAAPTARRAEAAEHLLLDVAAGKAFADAVVAAAAPIDDHRAPAQYRSRALGVLSHRVHRWLWDAANGSARR